MAKANNTTDATTAPTTADPHAQVAQVDPASLLVDVNVRTETVADKDFIVSVKDLGILQPIRAVRTADGALRMAIGHRRTRRTRMKRPQVDQALAVTRSDLAKAASVRYELTIDQAAGVAEFEDDPDTVKALVAAAKAGQFAHVLERAREDCADAAQRAQAEADLAATVVRVIPAPAWTDLAKRIGWAVRDAEDNELTAEQHASCPGHVAWVEQDWVNVAADGQVYDDDDTLDALDDDQRPQTETVRRWVPVLGCQDPATHHPRPGTTAISGAGAAEAGASETKGEAAEAASTCLRTRWSGTRFLGMSSPTGCSDPLVSADVGQVAQGRPTGGRSTLGRFVSCRQQRKGLRREPSRPMSRGSTQSTRRSPDCSDRSQPCSFSRVSVTCMVARWHPL